MANRRLMGSSRLRDAASDMRSNKNVTIKTIKLAYFNPGTLLLSLVVVSCLILTDCASHGHHLNKRQWRNNQPEYLLSSMPLEKSDVDWNVDIWPHQIQRSSYRQPSKEISQANFRGVPYDSVISDTQQLSDSDQQLLQQLLLARQLSDSKLVSQPASSDQSDYSINNYEQQQLDDYRTAERLAELFGPSRSSQRNSPRSSSENDQIDLRDSPSDSYHTKPSLSFVSPIDLHKTHSEPNFVEPDVAFGREEQAKNEYRIGEDENDYKRGDLKKQQVTKSLDNTLEETHGQLTTLLEDEVDEKAGETKDVDVASTTTKPEILATTTAVYGSVVTGKPAQHENADRKIASPSVNDGSVLDNMYQKLSSYLPFLQQLSMLKSPPAQAATKTNGSGPSREGTSIKSKVEPESLSAQISDNNDELHQRDDTKQRASGLQPDGPNINGIQKEESSEDDNRNNDKQSNDRIQPQKADFDGFEANSVKPVRRASVESDTGGAKIVAINQSDDNDSANKHHPQQVRSTKTISLHMPHGEVHIKEHLPGDEDDDRKVSMFRQSSVSIPLASEDQFLEGKGATSLLGKYVYAPEHHYHLNTGGEPAKSKVMDMNDEQMYTHMSHRSYSRQLRPGDNVYGSFNGAMGPIYGSQTTEGNPMGVQNKTNDLYFLVMVAAFCVMAMAVVLSAGLFAYRVQQSRKTTTESDYPTYGVVGPNNMSAKCGAAGFMGGYFGATGPGSSTPGSKTGSTKQLADTCSTSDSGVVSNNGANKSVSKRASNDPGGNAGNFMANQNAARMYHYQHQKQQMIISDHASTGRHTSASDLDSEDENDDGSYTVYECPGLASAHEMEIKNPLFNDDQTP